jgi:cobalt/nickel transport system permease protein
MMKLAPQTRLLLALAASLACVASSQAMVLAGIALMGAALALVSGMRPLPLLRRVVALEGFLVAGLVALPFSVPGQPLAEIWGLVASREGVEHALLIALKCSAAGLSVMGLLGGMDATLVGRALARLGLPMRLVHLLWFTARYIAVLEDEYKRLRTAMRARAFRPACSPHCWRSFGYLFGMLLVRSLERAERIDAAMRCRGFAGHFPSLHDDRPHGAGWLDWGVAGASVAGLAVLVGL